MDLDKLIRMIGSIVISVVLMSIPILCACSFALNWFVMFKIFFIWGTLTETVVLSIEIYFKAESEVAE
jgi:hypothetical protein